MMNKAELEQRIQAIRSLKALKEETENELKALENEVISYLNENNIEEEFSDTSKITYLLQERRTLDKDKIREVIGDLSPFEKVTTFRVLRIKQ